MASRPRTCGDDVELRLAGLHPSSRSRFDGGADQRQMRKGLREVAEQLAARTDLLGVEAEVIGVGEHLLEGESRLGGAPGAGKRLDVPEAADRERAFVAFETVGRGGRVVAEDEAVGDEVFCDRVEGREPARVVRGDEVDERHQQDCRIEHVGPFVLHERLALLAPALLHQPAVDLVPHGHPAHEVAGEGAVACDPDRAVERDPAHQPGVGEALAAAAGLPDALVGRLPVLADPVDHVGDADPLLVVHEPAAGALHHVGGVEQLAVDVELELAGGAVSDSHRGGAHVALEVRELELGKVRAAVDPVHQLQRAGGRSGRVARAHADEGAERLRLLREAEPEQRVEGEGGVANPGVAVVPVPAAAELLREARRRGRDDGAGRRERQQLEREGGAVDELAPPAGVRRLREPLEPVRDGRLEQAPAPPARRAARVRRPPRARTCATRPWLSVNSA